MNTDENNILKESLSFEREKIQLERERLELERERLETERTRHRQTVELSNRAAGRIVLPASTFTLSIVLALFIGGISGAWIVATNFKSKPDAIAASVAEAIGSLEDGSDNTNALTKASIFRTANPKQRGTGYLLILD